MRRPRRQSNRRNRQVTPLLWIWMSKKRPRVSNPFKLGIPQYALFRLPSLEQCRAKRRKTNALNHQQSYPRAALVSTQFTEAQRLGRTRSPTDSSISAATVRTTHAHRTQYSQMPNQPGKCRMAMRNLRLQTRLQKGNVSAHAVLRIPHGHLNGSIGLRAVKKRSFRQLT